MSGSAQAGRQIIAAGAQQNGVLAKERSEFVGRGASPPNLQTLRIIFDLPLSSENARALSADRGRKLSIGKNPAITGGSAPASLRTHRYSYAAPSAA